MFLNDSSIKERFRAKIFELICNIPTLHMLCSKINHAILIATTELFSPGASCLKAGYLNPGLT